ncbi:hypothetical protein CR513_11572, partial [Mucuna pruriens]
MEIDLMRAQIRESEETTMVQFLHGLNRKIQDVLVHQAIKVEMQIRRSASRKTYVGTSGWNGKEIEKEKSKREKSPKKGNDLSFG